MKSGYKVFWTDHALDELEKTIEYLQLNFTAAEIARLARAIEITLSQIVLNPLMYQESARAKGVHRAVVLRFNSLYYRVIEDKRHIEVVSFFSNRQSPESNEF
jgi:plasmid stabilization system protein ParE